MSDGDRVARLRRFGRWHGEQRHAIAWTATNKATGPEDGRPKEVRTKGWQHTRPLADGDVGETMFGRGLTCNPTIVLRPSRLVGIECDSELDLAAIDALKLPATMTVRSSEPYKRHFWFLPPAVLETIPFAAFRFEHGAVWADEHRYLLCPPAIHPTGVEYEFLPEYGPDEIELAELPVEAYSDCVRRWQNIHKKQRERLRVDPAVKVELGTRHDAVFRFACALRRWMADEDEILSAAVAWNERHCDPPMSKQRVRSQVRGALKLGDRPPDAADLDLRRKSDTFLREFLAGEINPPPVEEKPTTSTSKGRRELRRRPTSTIPAQPVEWLVPGVVPLGTLTLVAGVGGLGKSALVLAWASDVTREGGNVLVVSYEDAAEQVIRPRFEALDGDLDRLFELSVDTLEGSISFPTDLDELARHATETDARLIVIDPVSASIDLKLDAHKDAHVRVVLGQLAKLAEKRSLAVVMVAHLNKAPTGDVYLRVNGSTAFYNASRSVLTVTRDPLEELYRLVAHHKSNYGLVSAVERWMLEVVEVPSATGLLDVARLRFLEVADDVSRDDVLAPRTPHVPKQRTEAEAVVVAELAEGRRLSSEVKAAGARKWISEATMKRAAAALDVVIEDESTSSGRVTYWSLPDRPGGRLMPRPTRPELTLVKLHEHRDSRVGAGGSAHDAVEGAGPTSTGPPEMSQTELECLRHEGPHKVTTRAAGYVFLACGCFLEESP